MLRERRSFAISERPTPSFFATSSLLRTLSPTIPAHRRHSPVSLIIPALTQKQGGGGYIRSLVVRPSSVLSVSSAVGPIPSSCSPLATSHSPLTLIIPAPLATAALRVVPASIVTTTSRIHVGAPTICSAGNKNAQAGMPGPQGRRRVGE